MVSHRTQSTSAYGMNSAAVASSWTARGPTSPLKENKVMMRCKMLLTLPLFVVTLGAAQAQVQKGRSDVSNSASPVVAPVRPAPSVAHSSANSDLSVKRLPLE